MNEIEKAIDRWVSEGYPRNYVLTQLGEATRIVTGGLTPDGEATDMCCAFWELLHHEIEEQETPVPLSE